MIFFIKGFNSIVFQVEDIEIVTLGLENNIETNSKLKDDFQGTESPELVYDVRTEISYSRKINDGPMENISKESFDRFKKSKTNK